MSTLSLQEKVAIFSRIGEEILEVPELEALLAENRPLRVYDGFEPSGRIHIAQGLLKAINVNRMIKCGCTCVFYVADWFALLNNKCEGDLNKIKRLGQYFIEVWKASGMDMSGVEFVWASDFISSRPQYWGRVMDIARSNTLTRVQRCSTIMGRSESDEQPVAQIMYPCMQCSDVFELGIDICQLGIDQRKVNMLAREYATKIKVKKPVIVSHHMLLGLIGGKMSKSIQGSAIFMDDSTVDINAKIMQADCPDIEDQNPVLEYYKYIVFGAAEVKLGGFNKVVVDEIEYTEYSQLLEAYLAKKVSVQSLKVYLVQIIDQLINPVRKSFQSTEELKDLKQFVVDMRVTR
ncbi:Tyrosyl-tRNA_synthetase [Hexamita inflata]|uniref:tyrosine--tRNA ligase n=1 Tax=Hexamita inflata TaxID=28002 RepID=A0AA86RLW5_9EUKA|nr:Tyrosyl-tRNA synthetase [Hexamita inflata]